MCFFPILCLLNNLAGYTILIWAACLSNLQNIGLLSFDFFYCLYWGSPEGGKYILYVYIIYIVIYFICIICIIYYIYKELAYTVVEAE